MAGAEEELANYDWSTSGVSEQFNVTLLGFCFKEIITDRPVVIVWDNEWGKLLFCLFVYSLMQGIMY